MYVNSHVSSKSRTTAVFLFVPKTGLWLPMKTWAEYLFSPMALLMKMFNLCHQKLADDSVLVIETPNPFSLYAAASYALENSNHLHPLHPETLRLLCVTHGFLEPTVMFLSPLPPEEHLEELELTSSGAVLDPRQQELFQQANKNFAKINRILFSHSDYAVVTRRGSRGGG